MYREVYADNAATTKMDKRVIEKISEYWEGNDGNPSSIYRRGLEAKNALEEARAKVASLIGAEPPEEAKVITGLSIQHFLLRRESAG